MRIKPCPFCGNDKCDVSRDWPDSAPQVFCFRCGTRGPHGIKSDKTAISAWNHRASTCKDKGRESK